MSQSVVVDNPSVGNHRRSDNHSHLGSPQPAGNLLLGNLLVHSGIPRLAGVGIPRPGDFGTPVVADSAGTLAGSGARRTGSDIRPQS